MAGQPRANREDNTSLVVGLGMAILSLLGVATVFGDAIAAALAPGASPPLTHEEPAGAPAAPASISKPTNDPDAGGGKS